MGFFSEGGAGGDFFKRFFSSRAEKQPPQPKESGLKSDDDLIIPQGEGDVETLERRRIIEGLVIELVGLFAKLKNVRIKRSSGEITGDCSVTENVQVNANGQDGWVAVTLPDGNGKGTELSNFLRVNFIGPRGEEVVGYRVGKAILKSGEKVTLDQLREK